MSDRGVSVLEKYNLVAERVGRAKGASLIEADGEIYLLKEFYGTEKHLETEKHILTEINNSRIIKTDCPVMDSEGNLLNEDDDRKKYVLRKWYQARDFEIKSIKDIIEAAVKLGELHKIFNNIKVDDIEIKKCTEFENYAVENEFLRHTKELRKTRNFIRKLNRKNELELMILGSFDMFYKPAEKISEISVTDELVEFISDTESKNELIHGTYNYHNILFADDFTVVMNFEHLKYGIQICDLYDYLRKVMEKYNWDIKLGEKIIDEYNNVRKISDIEMKYFIMKLKYPEKYWKIINHYYNNNKSWIPDKDIIKLRRVIEQEKNRNEFISSIS